MAHEEDLDEFLQTLDGVEVGADDDFEAWAEIDEVADVVSVPDSNKASSKQGTPTGSHRSDSPPAPSGQAGAPTVSALPAAAFQLASGTLTNAPPQAAAGAAQGLHSLPYKGSQTRTAEEPAPAGAATQPLQSRHPASAAPAGSAGQSGVPLAPTAAGAKTAAAIRSNLGQARTAGAAGGPQPPEPTQPPPATAGASALPPAAAATQPGNAGRRGGSAAAVLNPTTYVAARSKPGHVAGHDAATKAAAIPPPPPAAVSADPDFPAEAAGRLAHSSSRSGASAAEAAPGARVGEELSAGPGRASTTSVRPGQAADEIEQQVEGDDNEGEEVEEDEGEGGGWGGWGALGRWKSSLHKAAAGAVKDVSELTESFQQVLQEIATAPDEDEEQTATAAAAAATAAQQGIQPGQQAGRAADAAAAPAIEQSAVRDGSGEGSGGSSGRGSEEAALPDEEEARRQQVLARLTGEETTLDRGVVAYDRQVEQLSANAGRALSSLWGWGATLAQRVEQAASTAAKELAETVHEASPAWHSAAGGLADAGKPMEGLGLGDRLGQLGRTAKGLLESGLQGAGSGRAGGTGGKDDAMSFDESFYVYGGQQAFEELESLSNECARLCNRLRAKLPDDEKANLDKVLALLAPLFELGSDHPSDTSHGGTAEPAELPALTRGHAVIADLAAAGCARADAMAHEASQRAEVLLAPPLEDSPPAEGREDAAAPAATTGSDPAPQEPRPAVVKMLQGIQAEGVKRLAEVASVCIERLQALARSVSAQFRFGRPANDGIAWPAAPEAKALLLRGQAMRMLEDLEAVGECFTAALLSAGRAVNAHAEQKVYAALSEGLVAGLSAAAAVGKVQDSYRCLMYVVWLTSVDREWMEA